MVAPCRCQAASFSAVPGSDVGGEVPHAWFAAAHLLDSFVPFHPGCCGVHDRSAVEEHAGLHPCQLLLSAAGQRHVACVPGDGPPGILIFLPRGLAGHGWPWPTAGLETVEVLLAGTDEDLSATEVAERTGMSRATAQRYLTHLHDLGRVAVRLR